MGIFNKTDKKPTKKTGTTVINTGTTMKGMIDTKGSIFIDGKFEGIIVATEDVTIGKNGEVLGEICAKVLIVNGNRMIAGSYNFSASAEERNFENVMVFNGSYPGQQDVIDRMATEFEFLWNSVYDPSEKKKRNRSPQVIDGPEGRKKVLEIFALLKKKGIKKIIETIDSAKYVSATFKDLKKAMCANALHNENL